MQNAGRRHLQFCSYRRGLMSLLGPEDTAREALLWTLRQHRASQANAYGIASDYSCRIGRA